MSKYVFEKIKFCQFNLVYNDYFKCVFITIKLFLHIHVYINIYLYALAHHICAYKYTIKVWIQNWNNIHWVFREIVVFGRNGGLIKAPLHKPPYILLDRTVGGVSGGPMIGPMIWCRESAVVFSNVDIWRL